MDRRRMAEILSWLQLARCEGVGPVSCTTLIERYGTVDAALQALQVQVGPNGAQRHLPDRSILAAELAALADLSAHVLPISWADYPPQLRPLPDAPPAITVRGDPGYVSRPAVAVVGARNASANGCAFARRLGRELAEAGLVVVSGLARGIDTAAHQGALAAAGATVAVIATGVDIAYPPENAEHGTYRCGGCSR